MPIKISTNIWLREAEGVFRNLNLNPLHKNVGDCTVRAISLLMNEPWDKIYTDLSVLGFEMKDLLDSNAVWGRYLNGNGYRRHIIPDYVTKEDFNAFADKMINMLSEQRKPRFEKNGGQKNVESAL